MSKWVLNVPKSPTVEKTLTPETNWGSLPRPLKKVQNWGHNEKRWSSKEKLSSFVLVFNRFETYCLQEEEEWMKSAICKLIFNYIYCFLLVSKYIFIIFIKFFAFFILDKL